MCIIIIIKGKKDGSVWTAASYQKKKKLIDTKVKLAK